MNSIQIIVFWDFPLVNVQQSQLLRLLKNLSKSLKNSNKVATIQGPEISKKICYLAPDLATTRHYQEPESSKKAPYLLVAW